MLKKMQWLTLPLIALPLALGSAPGEEITTNGQPVLWRNPTDITSRNLFYGFYGPGGKDHEPHGTFSFTKEDLDGTSPKFFVRDQDGVKWKVKLGSEARPETVASRITWAVGYFTNEDYFVENLQVENLMRSEIRGVRRFHPQRATEAISQG